MLGMLLVIYSIVAFDSQTPFPSLYTLIPTVGAALIILCASHETVIGKCLGNRWFVDVGLLSYSAYLWHQPLFAFAKHASLEKPTEGLFGALSALSIVLAYFSWKYVEVPFRNKRLVNRKQIFLLGTIGSFVFIGVGLAGHVNQGFENRLGREQKEFLAFFENGLPDWQYFTKTGVLEKNRPECDFYDTASYRLGKPSQVPLDSIPNHCYERTGNGNRAVFIWGDSHAQQLYYGLRQVLPSDWQIFQVTTSGCGPKTGATENRADFCEFSNWFAYNQIASLKPDVVVIGQNRGHNALAMNRMADQLIQAGVGRVILAGPSPHWLVELPAVVAFRLLPNTPARTFASYDGGVAALDRQLKAQVSRSTAVRYVSIIDNLCNENGCRIYFGDDVKSGITTWDYGHLTPIASYHFANDVLAEAVRH